MRRGFSKIKGVQNTLNCIHAIVIMQDTQDTKILKGLLQKLLDNKSEIKRFSKQNQTTFNRLLTTLIKVLEIEKVDIGTLGQSIKNEVLKADILM